MTPKTCFFIAPIGEADTLIRRRSDQVLKHIVRGALEPMGYVVARADEVHDSGLITNQIIERVIGADMVVADLAGSNANVFYELAVRHAARKPALHLAQTGEQPPFDVANVRAVPYALDDPDALEHAKTELRQKAEAVEMATHTAPNPITAATDLQLLRGSQAPESELVAEILTAVADLRVEVRALSDKLADQSSASPSPRQISRSAIKIGDQVAHASFGDGEVVQIDDDGIVVVRFVDDSTRKLMWDYAPIRLL